MKLYEVIRSFLEVWFPSSILETYDGEITLVCALITAGLVLYGGYLLLFGWWRRK